MGRFAVAPVVQLAVAICLFADVASAQDARIDPIPGGLSAQAVQDLESRRASLLQQRDALQGQVTAFNGRCASVPEESPRVAQCAADQELLESAIRKYNDAVERYNKVLAGYRCRAAQSAVAKLKKDIDGNQQAIRKIGLATTAEAYERLEDMTADQLRDFEGDMLEATLSAFVEFGKLGATNAGSIGTAEGAHILKRAKELGAGNPHVLELIEAFYRTSGKPEMARTFNAAVTEIKKASFAAYHGYKIGGSSSDGERAWRLAAIALLMSEESYPQLANELRKRFPALAYSAAKGVTVSTGVALAAPTVSFVHNMRVLGYTKDAIASLDVATGQQLDAINRAHERMKHLVKDLKAEQKVLAGCRT